MLRTLTIALSSMMMLACAKADQPGTATAARAAPTGSGTPTGPAPAAIAGNSELENRGVTMMQRLADVFAGGANDCDKLAFDIKAFVVEHRELLDALAELERTQTENDKAAFEARNQAAQDAVAKSMAPALEACGDNANVRAAMAQFPTS